MSDKTNKTIYWVTTGLLTLMMLMTIGNSIFNNEFSERFSRLGYPTYLIVPLMVTKSLGLIAIWSNKSKTLKEWAYAGFFFDGAGVELPASSLPQPGRNDTRRNKATSAISRISKMSTKLMINEILRANFMICSFLLRVFAFI